MEPAQEAFVPKDRQQHSQKERRPEENTWNFFCRGIACRYAAAASYAKPGQGRGDGAGYGASSFAPGHMMRNNSSGTYSGPGASGYAPGRMMRNDLATGTVTTRGATTYAPGRVMRRGTTIRE